SLSMISPGRVSRSTNAIPRACVITRKKFGNGRGVWQNVRTRRRGDPERPQSAEPDMLDGRWNAAEEDLHLPGKEVRKCKGFTAIRDMNHADAGARGCQCRAKPY